MVIFIVSVLFKMAESKPNMESNLKNLKLNQKTDINILLLGPTSVGKSTLINSFANYLTYGDLKSAEKDKLMVLIPTQLNVLDKYGESHVITTGDKDSDRQDIKTYVFPIWNGHIHIRLIDTPGMENTAQEGANSENILNYISNLHELHAICFLLKPNESRHTVFFKNCIDQIFSRLDETASNNIIFCFTNTRETDYSPGETAGILRIVEDISSGPSHATIPYGKNIFCFDNESFSYLAAVKKGIKISSDIKQKNKESWEKSAEQCWKLIKYIVGDKDNQPLEPYFVKSTNTINEARRMINHLAQPIADIMQLIHHNMSVLDRHRKLLKSDTVSMEEITSKLYMPVITLEVTQLDKPVTVCASRKCAEVVNVAGNNSWNYKQKCHDPCYLTNVGRELIGDSNLKSCAAMQGKAMCTKCYCNFEVHMHIYYETKIVEMREIDKNVQMKSTNTSELMQSKHKLIEEIENKQKELAQEHKTIVETSAKFAHFLQNNALTPVKDSYKDYIEYLIDREKSLGKAADQQTLQHLNQLLQEYSTQRITITLGREEYINTKEISESVHTLYMLKHNGRKIRELYNCQKKARNNEFQKTEYLHKVSYTSNEEKQTYDKEKKGNRKSADTKDKESKSHDQKEKSDGNVRRKQQFKGNHRGRSPPPSYQEIHPNPHHNRHQTPNRHFNQGYSDNFNRSRFQHFQQHPNMFPPSGSRGFPPNVGPNSQQFFPQHNFPHPNYPQQNYPLKNFKGNMPNQQQQPGCGINFSLRFPFDIQVNTNQPNPNSQFPNHPNSQFPNHPNSQFPNHPNSQFTNQPHSSNIPSLFNNAPSSGFDPRFAQNMPFPRHHYQRHGVNWQNVPGNQHRFRNNEHAGRYRDNRNGGVNKRTRGKKGKGNVNNVKEDDKNVSKKDKKKKSSSESDSSSSSKSDSSSSSESSD